MKADNPQNEAIAVRKWGSALGWKYLRRFTLVYEGVEHTFYTGGRLTELRLQVNQLSKARMRKHSLATHMATVFSERYRVSTGWHELCLKPDGSTVESEARRLNRELNYHLFATEKGRRSLRSIHPEFFSGT